MLLVFRSPVAPAAGTVAAQHAGVHRFMLGSDHQAVWTLDARDRVSQSWRGRSSMVLSAAHRAHHSEAPRSSAAHFGRFEHQVRIRMSHRAPYIHTAPVNKSHRASHRLLALNPVARPHQALWSLPQAQVRRITGQPVLSHDGKVIELVEARLSADEDSAVWLAELSLARIEDFERITIGDEISLDLYGEVFNLAIDAKRLSRPDPARLELHLSALSPVSADTRPITRRWEGPVNARSVVEELLGNIDWKLPEWDIPNSALAAGGETPLSIARRIVGAVGGLIESAPDGHLIARPRHPVSIPQYAMATPHHVLSEADLIQVETRLEPTTRQDRFVIHYGADAAVSDRMEFIRDDKNPQSGTVRVYPSPWRSLSLAHTGDTAVSILPLGEVWREEREVIDIRAGEGEASYPVAGITHSRWQYADLGPINAMPDAAHVTSVIAGYSLLDLRYFTRAMEFAVSDPRIEEIQFLVLEDDHI